MRPNSFLRCSCTAAAISSNAWSGTIRTEMCARTFDGITVESAPPRHQCQRRSTVTRQGGKRTARPGNLDVVDRERGLAPARGEQRRRGLRHAREDLVQLPLVLRERAHAVVCEERLANAHRHNRETRRIQKSGITTRLFESVSVPSSLTLRWAGDERWARMTRRWATYMSSIGSRAEPPSTPECRSGPSFAI